MKTLFRLIFPIMLLMVISQTSLAGCHSEICIKRYVDSVLHHSSNEASNERYATITTALGPGMSFAVDRRYGINLYVYGVIDNTPYSDIRVISQVPTMLISFGGTF